MRAAALLLAALFVLLVPAHGAIAAASPQPKTTVEAVEHEVMCPICGTLLELAESPQAQRERVFVAKLVTAGKSKAEIKDALVAQYGPQVLALPKASGFDLSAYLVPILAILVAIAVLAVSVARWRRGGGDGSGGAEAPTGPSAEDAERLRADLSRYDL
jgi:cytochrome c-type biogenesis protein CcmH